MDYYRKKYLFTICSLFLMLGMTSFSCGKTLKQSPTKENVSNEVFCCDYKPGRWWRNLEKLDSVILSAEEIVVSHRKAVKDATVSRYQIIPSNRTKKEALDVAIRVARKIRKNPNAFADFAKSYSDDLLTAPVGGYLGVFRARWIHEKILDGLAHLKEGEVSRIIETPIGFHIVRRLHPNEEKWFTFHQVNVRYRDLLEYMPGGYKPIDGFNQTREDAKILAEDILSAVKNGGNDFIDIVEEFSIFNNTVVCFPNRTLSNYEMNSYPPVMVLLSRLKEKKISGIIETEFGYSIVKRLEMKPKPAERFSYFVVDDSQIPRNMPYKNNRNINYSDRIYGKVKKTPALFDDLKQKYQNGTNTTWINESNIVLEKILTNAKEGDLLPKIRIGENQILIAKKESPISMQEARVIIDPVSMQIPNPPPLKYEEVFEVFSPPMIAASIPNFKKSAIDALEIKKNQIGTFETIMSDLENQIRESSKEKVLEIMQVCSRRIANEIGKETAKKFLDYHKQWINEAMENF